MRISDWSSDVCSSDLEVIASETGKPDFDAMAEVLSCAVLFTHTARRAPKVLAPEQVSAFPLYVKRAEIRYQPYGVVGVISPWNYPAFVPVQALSGVLAAGNTAVDRRRTRLNSRH